MGISFHKLLNPLVREHSVYAGKRAKLTIHYYQHSTISSLTFKVAIHRQDFCSPDMYGARIPEETGKWPGSVMEELDG
jgi:hypothetical protein